MTALECFLTTGSEGIHFALPVDLHRIDPAAQYNVGVRRTQDKGPVQTISGRELTRLLVAAHDMPCSTLVFYREK